MNLLPRALQILCVRKSAVRAEPLAKTLEDFGLKIEQDLSGGVVGQLVVAPHAAPRIPKPGGVAPEVLHAGANPLGARHAAGAQEEWGRKEVSQRGIPGRNPAAKLAQARGLEPKWPRMWCLFSGHPCSGPP